jgi:hypothetical protein
MLHGGVERSESCGGNVFERSESPRGGVRFLTSSRPIPLVESTRIIGTDRTKIRNNRQ